MMSRAFSWSGCTREHVGTLLDVNHCGPRFVTSSHRTSSPLPLQASLSILLGHPPIRAVRGTAFLISLLLLVIHLSLSTPLITTPHPLRLSVFLLPSQKNHRLPFFSILISFNCDLPLPFRPHFCQVVCFLIVLSENWVNVAMTSRFALDILINCASLLCVTAPGSSVVRGFSSHLILAIEDRRRASRRWRSAAGKTEACRDGKKAVVPVQSPTDGGNKQEVAALKSEKLVDGQGQPGGKPWLANSCMGCLWCDCA